jgi:VanZ family protein
LPKKRPFSKLSLFRLDPQSTLAFHRPVVTFWFRVKRWLPVLLWMAFIYAGSTDLLASHHTSRFIGPFLRWLYPQVTHATIARVQTVVRKTGHVTEYAILSLLLLHALRSPDGAPVGARTWVLTLVISALYAVSDEAHQATIPTRQGNVSDVLLDTAGAALGLAGCWWQARWRRRR